MEVKLKELLDCGLDRRLDEKSCCVYLMMRLGWRKTLTFLYPL